MSKRLSREEFVKRAIAVHKDKYSYQNVEYITMLKKVCITCKIHGDFCQTPADHIWNHGCPKCKADKKSFSWEEIYKQFPDKNKKYYTMKMLDTLVQMCGRCTRSEQDYSTTYILDGVIHKNVVDNHKKLPKHFIERFV
mgnify:CR=1 FL=1